MEFQGWPKVARVSIDSEEITALVIEINEYFENHPNAADSVQGITKWWLKSKQTFSSESDVLLALEYLYKIKAVDKTHAQSGVVIYSKANN